MQRVAFVLGAGGAGGWPFHLGVAAAYREFTGYDVGDAGLVIGTSAGATIGSLLKLDASIDDILRAATRRPSDEERQAFLDAWRSGQPDATRARLAPLAPSLIRYVARGARGLGVAVAGMAPTGRTPTAYLHGFPGLADSDRWPNGLWVTAVSAHSGEMTVFGRDREDVRLLHAVEASGAVPGVFAPKHIDGEPFIDGATRSALNLDLVDPTTHDTVIVSSVMTRPGRRPSRILARYELPRALAALRARGARVVLIEPDDSIGQLFAGFPRSGPEIATRIFDLSRERARRALAALG